MSSDQHDYPLLQIYYDCKTIKSLKPALEKNPVAAGEFTPYLSFFCSEAVDYFAACGFPLPLPDNAGFSAEDLRQDGKRLGEGYTRISRGTPGSFSFLCRKEEKRPVGSTWYQDHDGRPGEERQSYQNYAWQAIDALEEVFSSLDRKKPALSKAVELGLSRRRCEYAQIRLRLFPGEKEDQRAVLFLLHNWTFVNGALSVFRRFEGEDSGWWLRMYYITAYYAARGLLELKKRLAAESLLTARLAGYYREINLKDGDLFNRTFREAMLHYGMRGEKGESLLRPERQSMRVPLFGLVESCLRGMEYSECKERVIRKLQLFSEVMEEWLDLGWRK